MIAVTVKEAAELVSLSVGTLYSLIEAGRLRSKKIGKRRLVSVRALQELVDSTESSLINSSRGGVDESTKNAEVPAVYKSGAD